WFDVSFAVFAGHVMPCPYTWQYSSDRPNIQADQNPFGIGKIPDDFSDRLRELPDQGWNRQNLIAASERGIFQQVDDLQSVLAGNVCLAELLQVAKGAHRFRSLAGNIKTQLPLFISWTSFLRLGLFCDGGFGDFFHSSLRLRCRPGERRQSRIF